MSAVHFSAQVVDITTLAVDAIVNAANEQLAPGGGVCGAIHRAAGSQLEQACEKVGFCHTGDARITPGFNLPARYVIHAVGPIWQEGRGGGVAGRRLSSVDSTCAEAFAAQHRFPRDQHWHLRLSFGRCDASGCCCRARRSGEPLDARASDLRLLQSGSIGRI